MEKIKYWGMQYLKLIDEPIGREAVSLQSKNGNQTTKENRRVKLICTCTGGS